MKHSLDKKQKKNLIRIIVSLVFVLVFALLFRLVTAPAAVRAVCYLIPYCIVGYDVLWKAVKGVQKRQVFDENFLMAIASVGAMILGEFLEGVAVMLFYQIGELFEDIAVGRSRKNISDLMDICPEYANIIKPDGSVEQTDPENVAKGSILLINSGERVPIDGVVISGESALDMVALTGESLPVDIKPGDEILSGSINQNSILRIKTTKLYEDSTVARILELVEESSMNKARSEDFITKFAKYYTPVVCCLALILAVIPPLFITIFTGSVDWSDWIIRALTFLVISCPCAIVISVPLSFFGGIGCAASRGILVKGSNYLEVLADTKTIVFDKTGTLTKGTFQVTGVYPVEGLSEEDLVAMAAYAEAGSNHPIGECIRSYYGSDIDINIIAGMDNIPGYGVRTLCNNHVIAAGNARLMNSEKIEFTESAEAGTIVYVAMDGQFAGTVVIGDVIKEEASKSIAALKNQGISVMMLTGDNEKTAAAIAAAIGVDDYRAQLLPEDKVEQVKMLIENENGKDKVAYAGDGINDAPVISMADVGIAMGSLGSDAAIEAADVVLMNDKVSDILKAVRIARKTLRIVRENIVFAISVKVICLILGALGIASMWIAIFADVGVMIICVLNAISAMTIK